LWAIIGLGNPGPKYSKTRHNIGFMVIDEISEKEGFEFKEKPLFLISKGSLGSEDFVLVKPLTFMNRSGLAVKEVLSSFNIPHERLIIIQDDLDMDIGRIKIRKTGSSGGHKGILSIIEQIGTKDFIRVKIGIGKDPFIPAEDYVLSKFKSEEKPIIKEAIKTVVDAIESILREGVDRAMNIYNKRA